MLFQIMVLALIAIFIGISNSAGIGGGTILNVLLITGLNYTAKESIIISYIFLMGGGLAATITGAKKFTPSGKRYIDYDLVLTTLPMMMSGAIVGVMVNHLISQLAITIIFIFLIFNLMNTSYKRLKEGKQEVKTMTQELKEITQLHQTFLPIQSVKQNLQKEEKLEEILKEQKVLIPIEKLKVLGKIYVYTIVTVLFRGGKTFTSVIGLQSCGVGSFLLVVTHIMLSFIFTKSIATNQIKRDNQKESLGYVFKSQQEKMSYQKMNESMFNGFIAGVLGATVAIGGGLVLVPIWLKLGMQKEIVTNSTAPLIFFSASVSFFICALLGQYESVGQVLLYLCLSFVGSFFVKKFVIYMTEEYGFKKLVYVLLLGLMTLSLVVFLPLQFSKFLKDPHEFMQFNSFC